MLRKAADTTSTYILKLVGVGLLFTVVSVLSPQFPYAVLRMLIKKKFNKNYSKEQISGSLRYLKRKKFVGLENKHDKLKLALTKLGRKHLQKLTLSEIKIRTTAWNGLWRLLTFDIPEGKLAARRIFSRKLKQLGFFHFQRSVFILPFDCQKEIEIITQTLDITPYVHILIAQRFHSDKILVKKFHL